MILLPFDKKRLKINEQIDRPFVAQPIVLKHQTLEFVVNIVLIN